MREAALHGFEELLRLRAACEIASEAWPPPDWVREPATASAWAFVAPSFSNQSSTLIRFCEIRIVPRIAMPTLAPTLRAVWVMPVTSP